MSVAPHPLTLFPATGVADVPGHPGSVRSRAEEARRRVDDDHGGIEPGCIGIGAAPAGRADAAVSHDSASRGPVVRHWVGLAAVNAASIVGHGLSAGGFASAQWAAAAGVAAVSAAVGLSWSRSRQPAARRGRFGTAGDPDELRALLLQARAALADVNEPSTGRPAAAPR